MRRLNSAELREERGTSLDLMLLISTLSLVVVGVMFIYSSGVTATGLVISNEWIKQIIWGVTGLAILMLVVFTNPARLKMLSPWLYGGVVLVLIITPLIGREVHGARSWLGFGELGVQPSEFAKLFTILLLSAYLSEIGNGIQELPRFLLALLIATLPIGLILLQPDLGTALVYLPVFLVMALMSGARIRHLLYVFGTSIVTVILAIVPVIEEIVLESKTPVTALLVEPGGRRFLLLALMIVLMLAVWGYRVFRRQSFYWIMYGASLVLLSVLGSMMLQLVLRDYQFKRFTVFLDPSIDPRGAGWNIIQSVTAVGSGGGFGKGFLEGTQSHYQYLPQQSTDFIFSILAEEWGFVGGIFVLLLFAVIIGRGIMIFYLAKDDFASVACAGIIAMIAFHVVTNIGMAIGIMPITGIPLLFLSYGGSSLWTALAGVGVLLAVERRRRRPL